MKPRTFTTSHSGFKHLLTEELQTLVPLSDSQDGFTQDIPTPIFYHIQSDKFCVFMPDAFLRDIHINELPVSRTQVVSDEYVCFYYESLAQLRSVHATGERSTLQQDGRDNLGDKAIASMPYVALRDWYEAHLLDMKQGVRVIVVAFSNQQSTNLFNNSHSTEDILKAVIGSQSRLEFFQAYRFNQKYYLVNKDESLDASRSFELGENPNMQHLVVTYTPEDWALLGRINQKMQHIKNSVDSFFSSRHDTAALDKPLGDTTLLLSHISDINHSSDDTQELEPPLGAKQAKKFVAAKRIRP